VAPAGARRERAGGDCPQYLFLESSVFKRKNGHYFATCPPCAPRSTPRSLDAIRTGDVEVIGTDHCAFTRKHKDTGAATSPASPTGCRVWRRSPPGPRRRVGRGSCPASGWSSCSPRTRPSCSGSTPQGDPAAGSDADIVVFDPAKRRKIAVKDLHMGSDYSPYEGREVKGWVATRSCGAAWWWTTAATWAPPATAGSSAAASRANPACREDLETLLDW